jgi:Mn2+/Fe2+ NRAMP family transporter
MNKLLAFTLGILTAIGGFVDIGDLVTNALVGARFGLHLVWITIVGIIGICVYAEMSGRVVATSGRPTFDIIRERLGPRTGLVALIGSFLVTALTLTAELGGVSLTFELATGLNYLLFVPFVLVVVWLVLWRVKFGTMENIFGLMGLMLIVYAVAVWQAHPDWGSLAHQVAQPKPIGQETWPTYWYYAVALFGAALTPYEVFFFSSGGVEEHWTRKELKEARVNVFVGFPLGGILSISIAAICALVYLPRGIEVSTLGQTVLPIAFTLGQLGLIVVLLGIFAATFGAALETALSVGYTIAQYFGWQWGKYVRPREAPRFHALIIFTMIAGAMLLLTTVDPVKVTEYSVVFSAVALPLTYFPILIVANDRRYAGNYVNGWLSNTLGLIFLAIIAVASVAAIPLMIWTRAGQ